MRAIAYSTALTLCSFAVSTSAAAATDELCRPLRKFLASVGPNQKREIVFRTSWGENFKDVKDVEPGTLVLGAKRCEHNEYEPAKPVCDVLMRTGSIEFGNVSTMRAVVCISPKIRFPQFNEFEYGEFSLTYGSEDSGANVTINFDEDSKVGGMALRIAASGY